jgi:Aldose 1-epimerase
MSITCQWQARDPQMQPASELENAPDPGSRTRVNSRSPEAIGIVGEHGILIGTFRRELALDDGGDDRRRADAARRKVRIADPVTITAETDRVYLDTPGQCVIEDRGWRRRIVIEKDGAASSVVWDPWAEKAAALAALDDPAWRGMVCVETGNIADNEVRLAADAGCQMPTAISLDAAR